MEVTLKNLIFQAFFAKKPKVMPLNGSTARSNVKLTKNANTFEIGSYIKIFRRK